MPPLPPFPLPSTTHPIKSPIFHSSIGNPHDSVVPPTDQLESLLEELRRLRTQPEKLKQQIKEAKGTVERSLHRIAEREQAGLLREEPPMASPSSPDDVALSLLPRDKNRQGTPSSVGGDAPTRKIKKDKVHKKRKRDDEDGDSRATPLPSAPPAGKNKAPILPKVSNSTVQDFSVPPPDKLRPTSLLPEKPTPNPPHPSLPTSPDDVKEDFSKLKAPGNQIPIQNFYLSVDPYLRPIREEDLGWLEYTADEVEPFIIPHLGKHYLEVWAEADAGIFHSPGHQDWAPAPAAPNPAFDPSLISNEDLCSEDVGHGPLTERVVSALLPVQTDQDMWTSVKAAEDAMTGRPGGSGAAASRKEKSLVGGKNGLEERLGGTLRYHEILDPKAANVPDFTSAASDPISTALRMAQDELRRVISDNKSRKKALVERAKDLLAQQEYTDMRDQLDRGILALYTRQQKAHLKEFKESSSSQQSRGERDKKKRRRGDDEDDGEGGKPKIPPCALGLGPDEDNCLVVPGQLMELVRLRREWIDRVGLIVGRREVEVNGGDAGVDEDEDVDMEGSTMGGTGASAAYRMRNNTSNSSSPPTPMDVT